MYCTPENVCQEKHRDLAYDKKKAKVVEVCNLRIFFQ